MTKPVVIVGASMGGLRAAESLRRFGYAGPIVAIGEEEYPPYNRPPLSKEVLAAEVSLEAVAFPQRPATADVDWRLSTRVIGADLAAGSVETDKGDVIGYSKLIIATGLRAKRQDYPNNLFVGRHVIRGLDDALALRAALKPGAKVVILGSGFIGCETAATARKLGAHVTVVGPGELPILRPLGREFAAEVKRRQEHAGTQFAMGRRVVDLIGQAVIEGVVLDDGTQLPCDVFIEAIGSHPNIEWLESQDIDLSNGVVCNGNLNARKASAGIWPDVYAVGDVASFPNPIFDDIPRRVEHWNIPTECAKYVGARVAAELASEAGAEVEIPAADFKPIPSFWSDQFDMHILAFGILALADESRLIEGDINDDFVFGYYREGKMVGVAGVGMRSVVQGYRKNFEA
ncbi:MAG: FAD-dependent oxidoreductase [Actinomycetales bacterium]|nr:FAD-dependent oxidoreductase [Actinomycetales bacterium]